MSPLFLPLPSPQSLVDMADVQRTVIGHIVSQFQQCGPPDIIGPWRSCHMKTHARRPGPDGAGVYSVLHDYTTLSDAGDDSGMRLTWERL